MMPKKDSIHDNSNTTQNSKQLNLLKQHFPNCFDKEGNFISHKMEEVVGDAGLELSKESYSLNWLGKSYARLLANEVPHTLLKEDKVHNTKEANKTSENLLIKGDNLEVLKHLSNAYSESVKMIYIDPPYNTGGDGFVYDDDRKFSKEELAKLAGIDEDEAKRILEFTSSKSNSHSAWLTFMYPRLYVARELLREDGVIFISIDDNEVSQLKLLCDEVFGEENFVANSVWQKRYSRENRVAIGTSHEYVLIYAKSYEQFQKSWNKIPLGEKQLKVYKNPNNDSRGKWRAVSLSAQGYRPNQMYKIVSPITGKTHIPPEGSCWKIVKESYEQLLADNRIYFGKDGNSIPQRIQFLKSVEGLTPWTWWTHEECGHTDESKKEIQTLFGTQTAFDTPKPIRLLKRILHLSTKKDDIVLDFFAGSGTTAHAVMELNKEDNGNRNFITVQIPEKIDIKSESYKSGYRTIFDITKARIEKASEKLGDKSGFKIFETTPIFEGYLDDIAELNDDTKLFNGSNLNEEELETLLTTWKAYDGSKLTEPLVEVKLAEYTAQYGANTLYFMQKGFSTQALKALMAKLDEDKTFEPSKLVLFGYNFDSKYQRELKEALNVYTNKKEIDLEMVVRY